MLLCIIQNINQNYSIIPCLLKKSKETFKLCAISNKVCGFLLQVHVAPFTHL